MNRVMLYSVAMMVLGVLLAWAWLAHRAVTTIEDLLTENEQLTEAIEGLTQESQVGYAKVVEQTVGPGGQLQTRLRFVETDRDDPSRRVLEREFTVPGDTVYFDAMIVKFGDPLVMEGKERALYIWRRVFSEPMAPESGFPVAREGEAPERYADWLNGLPLGHRELFWSEVWSLANDPDRLEPLGISAIYGNAVYVRMIPGLIYMFRVKDDGQIFPEAVHDL